MTTDRVTWIKQRLQASLSPTHLEVIDQSEQHRGHAGAASGAGHFAVRIQAVAFEGLSRVQCHRLVYDALGEAIGPEIHALQIQIIPHTSLI